VEKLILKRKQHIFNFKLQGHAPVHRWRAARVAHPVRERRPKRDGIILFYFILYYFILAPMPAQMFIHHQVS
jgi:hypothetical protein